MKQNKAVTLIALIVTIIVSLILSGIILTSMNRSKLLDTTDLTRKVNRYTNAKEILILNLNSILIRNIETNNKNNIMQICKDIKNLNNITVDGYYNVDGTLIKGDLIEETEDINGIIVFVNIYAEYKFLIDENIKIIGATTKKIDDIISVLYFQSVDEFEIELFGNKLQVIEENGNNNDENVDNEVINWLKSIGIEEQYKYKTIDEVISDIDCLRKLMNNKVSIDYMLQDKSCIMEGICNSEIGLDELGKNEYASYEAIKDDTWCESIRKSPYESNFSLYLSKVDKITSTVAYGSNGLYTTNQEEIYVYSKGNGGGLAFNGEDTTYLPLLFDENAETAWKTRTSYAQFYPGRIGIKLPQEAVLYKVVIKVKNGDKFTDGIYIQGSSDLSNWATLSSNIKVNSSTYTINDLKINPYNTFAIYIPKINSDSNYSGEIYSLEFYYVKNDTEFVTNSSKKWLSKINVNVKENEKIEYDSYITNLMASNEAIEYMIENGEIIDIVLKNKTRIDELSKSNYAKYKVIMNENTYNKIYQCKYATYFDSKNDIIPKITTVTATSDSNIYSTNNSQISVISIGNGGDSTFSGNATTYLPYLFDKNQSTAWISRTTNTGYFPARLGLALTKNLICYKIEINVGNVSKLPSGFCIQASNDLKNWESLTTYIKTDGTSIIKPNKLQEFKYYVVYIPSATSTGESFEIREFKICCIEKVVE